MYRIETDHPRLSLNYSMNSTSFLIEWLLWGNATDHPWLMYNQFKNIGSWVIEGQNVLNAMAFPHSHFIQSVHKNCSMHYWSPYLIKSIACISFKHFLNRAPYNTKGPLWEIVTPSTSSDRSMGVAPYHFGGQIWCHANPSAFHWTRAWKGHHVLSKDHCDKMGPFHVMQRVHVKCTCLFEGLNSWNVILPCMSFYQSIKRAQWLFGELVWLSRILLAFHSMKLCRLHHALPKYKSDESGPKDPPCAPSNQSMNCAYCFTKRLANWNATSHIIGLVYE